MVRSIFSLATIFSIFQFCQVFLSKLQLFGISFQAVLKLVYPCSSVSLGCVLKSLFPDYHSSQRTSSSSQFSSSCYSRNLIYLIGHDTHQVYKDLDRVSPKTPSPQLIPELTSPPWHQSGSALKLRKNKSRRSFTGKHREPKRHTSRISTSRITQDQEHSEADGSKSHKEGKDQVSRALNPDLKDEKRLDVGEAKKAASPAAQENPFEQSLTERKYARKISLLLRTQSTRDPCRDAHHVGGKSCSGLPERAALTPKVLPQVQNVRSMTEYIRSSKRHLLVKISSSFTEDNRQFEVKFRQRPLVAHGTSHDSTGHLNMD
ncbi:conserved hypothetical protein [Coccidioides posadasii str. Silveira]|uniref:Uncharacterized protein n=1 Tax=Coccidioides posadasii (strain RMSCC 757 / Silveira) TaxID=443226 RepID=E9CX09_COCPS|nr:conserved hypothetical protein [Coccidioides posadasii str. Silveira]